jgi:Amt family ammonium transporter
MLRGSANAMLFAIGGVLVPLLYTWFVTSQSDPLMSARGLAAGVVAGLAAGPFVQLGAAFAIGLLAGATVPFITYLLNDRLRLDDATGTVSVGALPAVIGLLCVGLAADGVAGRNWNMTGLDTYLGVAGQGVSGLLTASGYQMDFPGQLQAQVIGILALGLWGLVMGMVICVPLGLLLHSLTRGRSAVHERMRVETPPVDARRPRTLTADAREPHSPAALPD